MILICPECKNEVDLSPYSDLAPDSVIECNVCGITLQVARIKDEKIEVEIIDEGK